MDSPWRHTGLGPGLPAAGTQAAGTSYAAAAGAGPVGTEEHTKGQRSILKP